MINTIFYFVDNINDYIASRDNTDGNGGISSNTITFVKDSGKIFLNGTEFGKTSIQELLSSTEFADWVADLNERLEENDLTLRQLIDAVSEDTTGITDNIKSQIDEILDDLEAKGTAISGLKTEIEQDVANNYVAKASLTSGVQNIVNSDYIQSFSTFITRADVDSAEAAIVAGQTTELGSKLATIVTKVADGNSSIHLSADQITIDGNMVTTGSTLANTIYATQGTIGGWVIENDRIKKFVVDDEDEDIVRFMSIMAPSSADPVISLGKYEPGDNNIIEISPNAIVTKSYSVSDEDSETNIIYADGSGMLGHEGIKWNQQGQFEVNQTFVNAIFEALAAGNTAIYNDHLPTTKKIVINQNGLKIDASTDAVDGYATVKDNGLVAYANDRLSQNTATVSPTSISLAYSDFGEDYATTITASQIQTAGSISGASITTTGAATAGSFVKTGGTSSQFLKADGSVDSNTYLTLTVGQIRDMIAAAVNEVLDTLHNGYSISYVESGGTGSWQMAQQTPQAISENPGGGQTEP